MEHDVLAKVASRVGLAAQEGDSTRGFGVVVIEDALVLAVALLGWHLSKIQHFSLWR